MAFWGKRNNRYSDLLKDGRSQPTFDSALNPPVLTARFDVGTLFTYNDDGSIQTHTLPHWAIQRLPQPTTAAQTVDPLHARMQELNPIPAFGYHGPMGLNNLQIFNPFPVTNGDSYLRHFRALGESAFLVPTGLCQRRDIRIPEELFHDIAEEHFQTHSEDESVNIVTAVYTASKWAMDYRPSPVEHDHYVVNVRNVQGTNLIPDDFGIRTSSPTISESPPNNPPMPYAILESHITNHRQTLNSKRSHWKYLFSKSQNNPRTDGGGIKKRWFPPHSSRGVFNRGTYSDSSNSGGRHVSRLHLGGTLSLLEVKEDYGDPDYFLEYISYPGFSNFSEFTERLLWHAQKFKIFEFEEALASLLFPWNYEFPRNLSPDFDFLFKNSFDNAIDTCITNSTSHVVSGPPFNSNQSSFNNSVNPCMANSASHVEWGVPFQGNFNSFDRGVDSFTTNSTSQGFYGGHYNVASYSTYYC